jgi:hypothetical protein
MLETCRGYSKCIMKVIVKELCINLVIETTVQKTFPNSWYISDIFLMYYISDILYSWLFYCILRPWVLTKNCIISVLWSDWRHAVITFVISTVIYLHSRSAPSGSGPPFTLSKLYGHTQNTQHSAGLLWTSERPLHFSLLTKKSDICWFGLGY